MTKQDRYEITYLNMDKQWSNLSHCSRLKLDLLLKDGMIISDVYNRTPTGFNNVCESILHQ